MTDTRTNEEISSAIAERLFGWKFYRRQMPITSTYFLAESMPEGRDVLAGVVQPFDPNDTGDEYHGYLTVEPYEGSPYAEDHNAALGLVVDAMLERPGYNSFECGATKSGIYYAVFRKNHGPSAAGYSENNEALPRAICLAALAALDAEEALPPIRKMGDPGRRTTVTDINPEVTGALLDRLERYETALQHIADHPGCELWQCGLWAKRVLNPTEAQG